MLEHVLSEELEELIAAKLGDPTHDPHGDPIPTRELKIEEGSTISLQALEVGARGTFARVSDSDPEMLRFLAERGIAPGDRARGDRQAAVRRAAVRPLRRQHARARWRAGARDARRGQRVDAGARSHPRARVRGRDRRRRAGHCRQGGARVPARSSGCSRADGCGRRSRCSVPRSWPRSRTSIPATSRRTSRAARSSATCCCGSCCSRT